MKYPAHGSLALLLALAFSGCASGPRPLWPGSKYTEADRANAMLRALDFIDRSAADQKRFESQASDYLGCFYSIADTARDPRLRNRAARLARETAQRWAKLYPAVPADAGADYIADLVFGWLSASEIGLSDAMIKPALRKAAARYTAKDFLLFDPAREPPPSDVPDRCHFDSAWNVRGAKLCRKCGRPLQMRTPQDVWMDALIAAYSGERYGVLLGARYRDVVQWTPVMRPYLDRSQTDYPHFIDTVYSLTHLIYTLNDYGRYLLSRDLLPEEYSYLRRNLKESIALKDPETTGEFLDTLRGFGLDDSDPVIQTGVTYLFATQRPDGSWAAPDETDPYTLYHAAWTGIDGLKEIAWRGEGLSFPDLRPLLERNGHTRSPVK
jgi:hypothetical protein